MANENSFKKWILGLLTVNSPMGRVNYFLSNLAVSFIIVVIFFLIGINMDHQTFNIVGKILFVITYIYFHFILMSRRIWHITEEKSKGTLYAFVLAVAYLTSMIPIIGLVASLVIFIAELILLFKPGCEIPDNDYID